MQQTLLSSSTCCELFVIHNPLMVELSEPFIHQWDINIKNLLCIPTLIPFSFKHISDTWKTWFTAQVNMYIFRIYNLFILCERSSQYLPFTRFCLRSSYLKWMDLKFPFEWWSPVISKESISTTKKTLLDDKNTQRHLSFLSFQTICGTRKYWNSLSAGSTLISLKLHVTLQADVWN